jgi:hypothetical protein
MVRHRVNDSSSFSTPRAAGIVVVVGAVAVGVMAVDSAVVGKDITSEVLVVAAGVGEAAAGAARRQLPDGH